MGKILFICPTERDRRELATLNGEASHDYLFHDYASIALEDLTAEEPPCEICIPDPLTELDQVLERCAREGIEAVVSTDDYPGSTMASIIAEQLHLPGTAPKSNLLCQHKFLSRQIQQTAAPEAVPRFHAIDVRAEAPVPADLRFPVFVKPVKSFFSVGAQQVDSAERLRQVKARWAHSAAFFQPFDTLLQRYAGYSMQTNFLLAEGVLRGSQATLDGYVFEGEAHPLGVVDSIMFPGTIAFQRFEYPSSLPETVQDRMIAVARQVLPPLGFRHGQFNIEFMYDPISDKVAIIEINPRMSSQFADLFEKVDGSNSYSVLLDLALGRRPKVWSRRGNYAMAASCVLRTFQNHRVLKLPSAEEIDDVLSRYPDARVEVLATEGMKLSQQMQDSCSFRYGLIDIGASNREEILTIFEDCLRRLTFLMEPVRGAAARQKEFAI